MDIIKIIQNINDNAKSKSTGYCTRHVRQALQQGGVCLSGYGDVDGDGDVDAADLLKVISKSKEFSQVRLFGNETGTISFLVHDINHPYGHVAIWNGECWVSDFKQKRLIPYSNFSGDIIFFKPNIKK